MRLGSLNPPFCMLYHMTRTENSGFFSQDGSAVHLEEFAGVEGLTTALLLEPEPSAMQRSTTSLRRWSQSILFRPW